MRLCFGLHARRHITLCLGVYHAIVFGDQKPTRNVLPERAPDRNSDTAQRYRPLYSGKHGSILDGSILCEGRREGVLRQPDQSMAVRCKLWRFGMGWEAVEYVRDFLTIVGCESGYVDQCFDSLRLCESDDRRPA